MEEGKEKLGLGVEPSIGENHELEEGIQSAWKRNPEGLAGKIRRMEEERRMMATGAYEAILHRRNMGDTTKEVPAKTEGGKVKIEVPKDILERNAKVWEFGLVGRFTGVRPELDKIRHWAAQRWKISNLEITALPKGCVLFNFQNKEEMLGVLLKAPWFMEGKGLLLEKWHEGFNPKDEESKLIPVWVQVPGLPLQAWDEDVIRGMASAIGKLIAIDSATKNRTRLIHARFCVLVRSDEQVPESVELRMGSKVWTQDFVYEDTRTWCPKCREEKHIPQRCPGKKELEQRDTRKKMWVPKRQEAESKEQKENNVESEIEERKEPEVTEEAQQGQVEEKEEEQEEEEEERESKEVEQGKEDTGREEKTQESPARKDESTGEEAEGFEKVQTRRARRRQEEGRMDIGSEEKKMGRPTEKEKREKEAASQIDMGVQKTLDNVRGRNKTKK